MNRLTLCVLLLLVGCAAIASDIPPPRPVDVAALVRQLGSEDFAEREAATGRLRAMALDPPAELLAATKSDNPEVRQRAAQVVQAMRGNVVATRLPRGRGFAERAQVDLFVAATAVWDLKPEDPRLWEPAQDLGRRLIEKAEMTGDRKPHNCPSSFKDFATYKRLNTPRFTRVNELYVRPDPKDESPPTLYVNEAIHAAGVFSPKGLTNNLIVSRGSVETQTAIQTSVVPANGDVTARNVVSNVVIICDGDVMITNSSISTALIVARGNITAKRGASRSVLMAGGKVVLEEKRLTTGVWYNVIKENEANTLGVIFFELAAVGVEAKAVDKAVKVTAVADGKPFAIAGVKAGDIIVDVNGKKPDSPESLRRLLRDALAIGDATVKLQRGDKTETVKVSLPE